MENTSYDHGSNLLAVEEEEAVEETFHTKNMVCSGYQREMGMISGYWGVWEQWSLSQLGYT